MADDHCWDAFGDDDDALEILPSNKCADEALLWLVQHFLKTHSKLSDRWIFVSETENNVDWVSAVEARGMKVVKDGPCDAAIISNGENDQYRSVVPGGVVLLCGQDESAFDRCIWNVPQKAIIYKDDETTVTAITKYACLINQMACPYKPNNKIMHGERLADMERRLVDQATVTRTAKELVERIPLSEASIQRSVINLKQYGYCILKQILDKKLCLAWGQAVVNDLALASAILLAPPYEVDLRHPHSSKNNPQSYREMAMREDLRMDLRDGPNLRKMRAMEQSILPNDIDNQNNSPVVTCTHGTFDSCLRFHPTILEIIKRTMNPKSIELYKGNFGRYNFSGTGPDGSPQPIRIGPMGGILSLPGAADQAIHADTSHLFEHIDCLPAHYINAFCLGSGHVLTSTDGSTELGGTAFVHGSHKLSFTAAVGDLSAQLVLQHIVRPSLELGDVVLFDCRVLHFGLANTSTNLDRPLLYVNYTSSWFHDPKNWNDRHSLFSQECQPLG